MFTVYQYKILPILRKTNLAVCVGVLAAEPLLPSRAAKCCSSASSKLLGAYMKNDTM